MKVMILTSATGSGHNMRARALALWAEKEREASWQVSIHEALESTHPMYRLGVETYNVIQRRAPWAHHLYFNFLDLASMHRRAGGILGRQVFQNRVAEERPDIVLSVHGHTNHGFFDLARSALPGKRPLCVTYCGEMFGGYGLSRHWINPQADGFIGAVPEICDAAVRDHGMPEAKTHCGGFLLRPPFYEEPEREEDRAQRMADLGLDRGRFTLLLSTGDAGANNHLAFLDALEAARLPLQVIALCGRNEATQKQVHQWASHQGREVRVVALGFQKDMHHLMRSVSAMVARPGTGATSEAILTGCPLIHNGLGGIMPQEWITVKFCRAHGFQHVIRSPRQLAQTARTWMDNPDLLASMRRRMASACPSPRPKELLTYLEKL